MGPRLFAEQGVNAPAAVDPPLDRARIEAIDDVQDLVRVHALGRGCARCYAPWHFLNFLPEPHQQGSLRPSFSCSGVTR